MSGILTNGLPTATLPLTGIEQIAADTQLTGGTYPESEFITTAQLANFPGFAAVATPDSGATQTLTAAMIAAANARFVSHVSTGGSTPTLTLPTVAALLAAFPGLQVGSSYVLRVINSNSGTATVATNTGWTTSGTLTLATNTTRDFVVAVTSLTAATITSIGTGTYS